MNTEYRFEIAFLIVSIGYEPFGSMMLQLASYHLPALLSLPASEAKFARNSRIR